MQALPNQELNVLVDLLVHYTALYTKMRADGATHEEFNNCKKMITALQTEIETRKNRLEGETPDTPPIPFTQNNSNEVSS